MSAPIMRSNVPRMTITLIGTLFSQQISRYFSTTFGRKQSSPSKHSTLPLQGITVVSIEQAIAGPYCTRQLADLGARVIKIERPIVGDFARDYDTRVDGLSSAFVWTNRSKESLALDLKQPSHLETLKKLLKKADVFVQNLAPGAAGRMGLSYEELRRSNSKLIVCGISGYGPEGPYRTKKAYDLLIQSESGMLSVTGTGKEPAKVGISIADISAGMYAYSNVLAAILQRQKTGKGCNIDISMLESMVEWMGFPMYYAYKNAPAPKPAGAAHSTIYPYGPFQTGNGDSVMLGIQNEREWANFCTWLLEDENLVQDARFCNNSKRVENRNALQEIITKALSKLNASETVERLDKAGIANAKVNDMKGVWNHPQLQARGRWTEVSTPNGPVPALIPPGFHSSAAQDGLKARMDPVPRVGEHNKSILAELDAEV